MFLAKTLARNGAKFAKFGCRRKMSSQSFFEREKYSIAWIGTGLATIGAVGYYRISTNPLNEHPSTVQALDMIRESGIAGQDGVKLNWFSGVSGKIYNDDGARLSFKLETAKGTAKVTLISQRETRSDVALNKPWLLREADEGDIWVPQTLTVDFLKGRERAAYNSTTDSFIETKMPLEAVEISDFFDVGVGQFYGQIYNRVAGIERWQLMLGVAGLAVPFALWRSYVKNIRTPPLMARVHLQLTSHSQLSRALGDPVKVSKSFKGNIGAHTAAFTIEANGEKESGTVKVQAVKDGSEWNITSSRLRVTGRSSALPIKLD